RKAAIARADAAIAKLRRWASHAPSNYAHFAEIVAAERHRAAGEGGAARESYDRAIALAHEHRYVNDEAFASELAGRFYLSIGRPRVAAAYLRDAHHAWLRWGASAKARDLEHRHPEVLSRRAAPDEAGTLTATTSSTVTSTGRTGAL